MLLMFSQTEPEIKFSRAEPAMKTSSLFVNRSHVALKGLFYSKFCGAVWTIKILTIPVHAGQVSLQYKAFDKTSTAERTDESRRRKCGALMFHSWLLQTDNMTDFQVHDDPRFLND
jgi:hypothetical protein